MRLRRPFREPLLLACLAAALSATTSPGQGGGMRVDYAPLTRLLERFTLHQLAAKNIPAITIALVDDQDVVWVRGWGSVTPGDSARVSPETVHRAGSVSKIFTALAVMQLAERGVLDLDTAVTTYLPDFRPENPFDRAITLRHLLAHRSGLVREPPVGSYFDPAGATLADAVASLNRTRLVYRPATRFKYSNAGFAVAARVVEQVTGEPFERYVAREVLRPLGMRHAGFALTDELRSRLAAGTMWTPDGRRFPAPTFPLGTAPAGNLYASTADLARFLTSVFAGGRGVVSPETLAEMWRPQYGPPGLRTGIGLGFMISELDGQRLVGHNGAVYGFATEVQTLPDEKLGVVALATLDVSTTVVQRIAEVALEGMRAARAGAPLPDPLATDPVPAELARALGGRYANHQWELELRARSDGLFLSLGAGGAPFALRSIGDSLIVDDPRDFGLAIVPLPGQRVRIRLDTFALVTSDRPAPAPVRWTPVIGEYGWDHSTLYVYEAGGRLYARLAWFFTYPLEELADSVFALPGGGLYERERLIFRRGPGGAIEEVEAVNVVFPRRAVGPADGHQLRVAPMRPIAELLAEARAAAPPHEPGRFRRPDLVDLAALDPRIRLDVRYATSDNFLSTPFYATARAFLQRPAAEALLRAHQSLRRHGYGVLVYDGYRPWHVTKAFWDATPDSLHWLVADPARGSRHNRGCAVDVTLYHLDTGEPADMGGTYDEATPRSLAEYAGGTALQRWHRKLLRAAMEAQDFSIYDAEWWHFDYRDWRHYPILNVPLDALPTGPGAR